MKNWKLITILIAILSGLLAYLMTGSIRVSIFVSIVTALVMFFLSPERFYMRAFTVFISTLILLNKFSFSIIGKFLGMDVDFIINEIDVTVSIILVIGAIVSITLFFMEKNGYRLNLGINIFPNSLNSNRVSIGNNSSNNNIFVYDPSLLRNPNEKEGIVIDICQVWYQKTVGNKWNLWASSLFTVGSPIIEVDQYNQLRSVLSFVHGRSWPTGFTQLKKEFENFNIILNDLLLVFDRHKVLRNERFLTEKFYDQGVRTIEKERNHDFHVYLIQDLTLELTRAGNKLLTLIREINPGFKISDGDFTITYGPNMNFEYVTVKPLYLSKKPLDCRYPGLEKFTKKNRFKRMEVFGKKDDYDEVYFKKYNNRYFAQLFPEDKMPSFIESITNKLKRK
jgi:hypothetical protein